MPWHKDVGESGMVSFLTFSEAVSELHLLNYEICQKAEL